MKPIHVYKLSVYNKPDGEDLNAEEIQEFIERQGVIRTSEVSRDE